MASSSKPEVRFLRYASGQTDIQTYRHAYRSNSPPPCWSKVKITDRFGRYTSRYLWINSIIHFLNLISIILRNGFISRVLVLSFSASPLSPSVDPSLVYCRRETYSFHESFPLCTDISISTAFKVKLHFWATVCKTVRPMLSDRCPVCLSVCDIGALWPNGCTDQDETRYAGRPRPCPRCVTWGPSSPSSEGAQPTIFRQCPMWPTAGWMKTPLGTVVELSPGHIVIVLDGIPALRERATAAPSFRRPMSIVATVAHLSYY